MIYTKKYIMDLIQQLQQLINENETLKSQNQHLMNENENLKKQVQNQYQENQKIKQQLQTQTNLNEEIINPQKKKEMIHHLNQIYQLLGQNPNIGNVSVNTQNTSMFQTNVFVKQDSNLETEVKPKAKDLNNGKSYDQWECSHCKQKGHIFKHCS